MTRLKCCQPTAQAAGSSTRVHGPLCDRADEPLSASENAEYVARLEHPAKGTRVPLRAVERPYGGSVKKRGARDTWIVGRDDWQLEDFV